MSYDVKKMVLGNESYLGSSADLTEYEIGTRYEDADGTEYGDLRDLKGQINPLNNAGKGFVSGNMLILEDGNAGEIWLDEIRDRFNADNIYANFNSAPVFIAGDETENVIVGSTGQTTMWGGAGNVSDMIFGNSSDDVFVYGKGEGNDTIQGANDNEVIYLYNVSFSDIVSTDLYGEGININFNNGNNLMVNDAGISSYSPTFEFEDGSRRYMAKGSVQWITSREATNTESTAV